MKQAHIIQTDRLVLRQFEAKDANGFYEMNADPEVIRHTGDLPLNNTLESAAQFLLAQTDHLSAGILSMVKYLQLTQHKTNQNAHVNQLISGKFFNFPVL